MHHGDSAHPSAPCLPPLQPVSVHRLHLSGPLAPTPISLDTAGPGVGRPGALWHDHRDPPVWPPTDLPADGNPLSKLLFRPQCGPRPRHLPSPRWKGAFHAEASASPRAAGPAPGSMSSRLRAGRGPGTSRGERTRHAQHPLQGGDTRVVAVPLLAAEQSLQAYVEMLKVCMPCEYSPTL